MTVAVDDAMHREWRDRIDGLVESWRTVIDLREVAHPADPPIRHEAATG